MAEGRVEDGRCVVVMPPSMLRRDTTFHEHAIADGPGELGGSHRSARPLDRTLHIDADLPRRNLESPLIGGPRRQAVQALPSCAVPPRRRAPAERAGSFGAGGYRARFTDAIADDLGLPAALAVAHAVASADDFGAPQRRALLLDFDRVLGLDLDAPAEGEAGELPEGARCVADRGIGWPAARVGAAKA